MSSGGAEDLAGLAALLKERVGLHLRPEGHASLRIAVLARYEEQAPPAVPPEAYLDLLRSPAGEDELRRLLPLVTVGKTQFFRDERQFRALAELLPDMLQAARDHGRRVAIWSAGCATGEEPYSVAMLAAEAGASASDLELLATDVNPEAVAFAAAGRYPARRVREVPGPLLERYFVAEGDQRTIGQRLRSLVSGVRTHNLVSAVWPRPLSGAWDAIFCRNVIIYFDTPTAQEVLGRALDALAPGGWLFLGYSESLFRMFEGFELTEVAGAFLYRKPAAARRAEQGAPTPAPPPAARCAPGPVRHVPPRALAGAPAPASPRVAFSTQELLDATVQLCAAGRFAEARERLERRLAEAGEGGEELAVRLTLANLLGILREPEEAAGCYRAALALEPLSAEAHLFYGVHLLMQGNLEGADRELSRSLFLDPDGAMAHYFLGRCREAQGDLPRARLCYRNAIEAHARQPAGRSHPFVGFYPDLPEDGAPFARAAEYALAAT